MVFEKIETIRKIIPNCAISTDLITGFCSETEEDHQATLSIMKQVKYEYAYTFAYSVRPDTYAAKKMTDDVPQEIKMRRLDEIIQLQHEHSSLRQKACVGQIHEVLVEGGSKKNSLQWKGRTSQNQMVVFDAHKNFQIGDYVQVKITDYTGATLKGEIV